MQDKSFIRKTQEIDNPFVGPGYYEVIYLKLEMFTNL